jgi:hypothetical protein
VTRRALGISSPLAFLVALVLVTPAGAASKIAIAALADAAPGGGVFAGPPFVSEPSAAGRGWIAFRAQLIGRGTESINAYNQVTGARVSVAVVGQTINDRIGRFKQFLGRPTISANGDVAFVAEITPPDDAPKPDPTAPPPPTPAGVFLWSGGKLSVVAEPGLNTEVGILDLTTPVNLLTTESGIDIAERTPGLNDAGDVAFVSATLDGTTPRGAIFLRRAGQPLTAVVKLGSTYEGKTFQILGPPAINNAGLLAFRGFLEGADNTLDGIFTLQGDTLALLIGDGVVPATLPAPFTVDPIFEFGDVVALNDAGEVVCTGGPFFDNSDDANLSGDGSPGVVLLRPGAAPLLVGFPGQRVELGLEREGRIFELTLGPEEGSRTAAPGLTPDGKVIFFATVNSGSSQAIFRVDPATPSVFPLTQFGGARAGTALGGGTYQSASSSPAVDADGSIVFAARIAGGTDSEELVWQPLAGEALAISIGDAVPDPGSGYFAGPALFPPLLNDAGDVVFKSHLASGPSSLGIFRYRSATALQAVVRVLDPSPLDGAPPFTNLVGDVSMDADGDIAFAATVAGRGRGIFATKDDTVRVVAMQGDELRPEDPRREGAFLRTIVSGPSLDDSGAVVFRGVVQFQSPFGPFVPDERQNCLFLADESGVHVIAAQDDDSGTTSSFVSFRDPVIRNNRILFRAFIGDSFTEGLFLLDGPDVRPVVVKGQNLGEGMALNTLQGKGLIDDTGNVFFKARVDLAEDETGGIVMKSSGAGLQPLMRTETRLRQGGRIQSLGRLSVSSDGNVALRLGFEPFSGGVPGLFLVHAGGPPETFLRNGEGAAAGINGRITSLNQSISVNRQDRAAFLASVGGGTAGNAIFLAAPSKVRVERLAFRRGPGPFSANAGQPRDRVRFTAVINPGDLPTPPPSSERKAAELVRARRKLVVVAVADSVGPLWSGIVQGNDTRLRGRTLRKKSTADANGGTDSRIDALRVQFRKGDIRITVRSKPFDLTFNAGSSTDRRYDGDTGAAILVPPFMVRVDAGEDGGSQSIDCAPPGGHQRFHCGG